MWILPIRKCAESVPKICVSAFFLQKARAETRNDCAGQKYIFTQKTNRKLKLKRTHSWFLHWQKRLVLSVVSSSRNRTFTNRSVLMPRFYTCETANPAISHVPYTWHAVRCILSAHCVPQRVFCSKSAKKSKGKVPHISNQTFQFTRSPGLSLSAVSPFSLKEKQGKSNWKSFINSTENPYF